MPLSFVHHVASLATSCLAIGESGWAYDGGEAAEAEE